LPLCRIVCAGKVPDELKRKTEAAAYVFANFFRNKRLKNARNSYRIAADAYAGATHNEINLHHQASDRYANALIGQRASEISFEA